MGTYVHCNTVHNTAEVGTIQCSFSNAWVNRSLSVSTMEYVWSLKGMRFWYLLQHGWMSKYDAARCKSLHILMNLIHECFFQLKKSWHIEKSGCGIPWLSSGQDSVLSLPRALGLMPDQGTKILQATWYSLKKKRKNSQKERRDIISKINA